MRWRALLALLAGLVAPGAAHAATCTSTGSGTWSAIGAGTATWSCGAGAAGDAYVIDNGYSVSITGNITQNGTAGAGITVNSGGTLTAAVSTARITVTLGQNGLTCAVGSTCTFAGRFRSYGVNGPTTYADPDTSAGRYFKFGDPLPCITGVAAACTAGVNYRVNYPAAKYDVSSGTSWDKFTDTSLSAIAAGEELCFFDPAPGVSGYVGADVNNCYTVTGSSTTTLDFSPRQGAVDQAGYPLTRRDVTAAVLAAAVTRGSRAFTMTSTTAITRNTMLRGRWVRFKPSGGAPDSRPYKILTSVDGGGGNDSFTIGDVRGFARDIAATDEAFIDYGWETGDPFFIMIPVRFTTATVAVDTDSKVSLLGTVSANGVVFEDTYQVSVGPDDLLSDRTPATISAWKNIIVRDMRAATQALTIGTHNGAVDVGPLNIVGGSTVAGSDISYRVRYNGSNLSFHDISARYGGDDCFVGQENGSYVEDQNAITITRAHCGPATDTADSGNMYDADPPSGKYTSVTAVDGVCDDCASKDLSAVVSWTSAAGGVSNVYGANLMGWGTHAGFGNNLPVTAGSSSSFKNIMLVGQIDDPGASAVSSANLVPAYVDGFVVRDNVINRAASGTARLFHTAHKSVKNGFFYNVDSISTSTNNISSMPLDGIVENVAFIDVRASGPAAVQNPLYASGTPTGGVVLRNVLFAQTRAAAGAAWKVKSFFRNDFLDPTLFTHADVAYVGLISTGATNAAESLDATGVYQGTQCFFNTPTYSGAVSGSAVLVFDQAPLFFDAENVKDSTVTGPYSCGVRGGAAAPGIKKLLWMHKISKIEPEFLGAGSAGGGGRAIPRAF